MQDLSTQEKIELIKSNVLFKGTDLLKHLDDKELKSVLEIIRISQVVPGDIIIQKGKQGDFMVLVLEGELGIYIEDKSGNEINIATVAQNSFVGEMAIIEDTPRMASVKAVSGGLLGTIYRNDFWDYFQKSPVFSKNILKAINGRVREISTNYINRLCAEKEELEKQVKEQTDKLREKDIKLLEMDRIAGIATLAAGVAHEINNPMAFVKSSISFIKKSMDKMVKVAQFWEGKPAPESIMKEYKELLAEMNFDYAVKSMDEKFERIKKGIDRIIKIVANLKSFSRVDMEEIGEIDVNKSIEEAIEVLRSQELENVEIIKNLQELPLMETSANEIHQCLLHTIQNAIDAVENEGIINISSSYNKEDDRIIITINNTGKCMSPDVLRQAMNPFFTTKPPGSGTGTGLSITEKIVRRHGGTIDLSSTEEEGTTVTMAFPMVSRMVTEKK